MAIRVIDLETTGIDSTAHVVEVGSVDLLPDGSFARFQEHLIKPPSPIPAEARAVHHISDEDVAQAKPWNTVSSIFFDRGNCSDLVAFAAHNAAFDQQWLPPDLLGNLPLICTYKAAVHVWPEAPTLQPGVTLLAWAGYGSFASRPRSSRIARCVRYCPFVARDSKACLDRGSNTVDQ